MRKDQGGLTVTHRYTYESYRNMIQRCYNPKSGSFDRYGGRGITVCDSWKESFSAFLSDMGIRPEGKSLDRVDVDGNYSKENCSWSDQSAQIRNRGKVSSKYSRYRGVSYDKQRSKWVAFIISDGKTKNLGRFEDELTAAKAYNEALVELGQDLKFLNDLEEV